jgi:hypothetical protein
MNNQNLGELLIQHADLSCQLAQVNIAVKSLQEQKVELGETLLAARQDLIDRRKRVFEDLAAGLCWERF